MSIMGFPESLSGGFAQQQLYYESPFSSHLTHCHFGEGIEGEIYIFHLLESVGFTQRSVGSLFWQQKVEHHHAPFCDWGERVGESGG